MTSFFSLWSLREAFSPAACPPWWIPNETLPIMKEQFWQTVHSTFFKQPQFPRTRKVKSGKRVKVRNYCWDSFSNATASMWSYFTHVSESKETETCPVREPIETCLFTTQQVEISRKYDSSCSAHLKSSCKGSAQMCRCYLIHQSRQTEGGVDKPQLPSLSSRQWVRMLYLPVAGHILLIKQMLHLNFHFKEFGVWLLRGVGWRTLGEP